MALAGEYGDDGLAFDNRRMRFLPAQIVRSGGRVMPAAACPFVTAALFKRSVAEQPLTISSSDSASAVLFRKLKLIGLDLGFECVSGGLLGGRGSGETLAVLFGRLGGGVALAFHLGRLGLGCAFLGNKDIAGARLPRS